MQMINRFDIEAVLSAREAKNLVVLVQKYVKADKLVCDSIKRLF